MVYRGVYQDGVVVLEGEVDLRNGSRVEVQPARRATTAESKKRAGKGARTSAKSADPLLKFFGVWKDRADWKGRSSVEVAKELRRRAGRRASR
jgi:hypothetical protein